MKLFDIDGLEFETDDSGEISAELDVTDVVLDLIAEHEKWAGHYASLYNSGHLHSYYSDIEDLHSRTAEFLKVFIEEAD